MAKRNTTGLPKKKKTVVSTPEGTESSPAGLLNKIQDSAKDETGLQRLIIIGVSAIVGILLLAILGGVAWELLVVPNQTIASVNGENITVAEFQERVRLERAIINQEINLGAGLLISFGQDPNTIIQNEPYATYWQEISGQPELLGSRVLNEMIDEQIIRAQAAELGVTVDEAAVNEQVERFFNYFRPTEEPLDPTATLTPTVSPTPFVSPTPSSTPRPTNTPAPTPTPEVTEEAAAEETDASAEGTPSPTPRPTSTPMPTLSPEEREQSFNSQVEQFYTQARSRANLNRETVRRYFEYRALIEALNERIGEDVERTGVYADVRHILVSTQAEAENVLAALAAGESFADLASAVSIDTQSGARGGELGDTPVINYVEPFRVAVVEATIGEITGPVESDFGFHILQVRSREERELTDADYQRAQNVAFNTWLEEVTSEENNTIQRGSNWPRFVPNNPEFLYEPVGVSTETAS